MADALQRGRYDLSDLDALETRVGSIFDDYYGDGDGDENGGDRCQELSDRLQEINERLADPELPKSEEIQLLHAMMHLSMLLRHPPCGGVVKLPG